MHDHNILKWDHKKSIKIDFLHAIAICLPATINKTIHEHIKMSNV
jgi:hypothetical protein